MAGNKLMSGSTGGARCYVRAPLSIRQNGGEDVKCPTLPSGVAVISIVTF